MLQNQKNKYIIKKSNKKPISLIKKYGSIENISRQKEFQAQKQVFSSFLYFTSYNQVRIQIQAF